MSCDRLFSTDELVACRGLPRGRGVSDEGLVGASLTPVTLHIIVPAAPREKGGKPPRTSGTER